jgi:hypothetical protein
MGTRSRYVWKFLPVKVRNQIIREEIEIEKTVKDLINEKQLK